MQESNFKDLNFSILGKKSNFTGKFNFSGDTLLNCQINGDITMLDNGKLTLERETIFEGNIYAGDIEVFGKVYGSITASGTLSIRSSAEISGVMKAKKMSIYPGAIVNMDGHTSEETQV